jgi:hypothetical protein
MVWDNARPILAAATRALSASGSLPDGRAAATIRDGILALALALNTVLLQADRRACRDATGLAAELGDCYEGRLRTFLNPHGRSLLPPRGTYPARPRSVIR